ncbi:MAG: S-methyl-5-thioribose-1-phosphate isomerase [Bacteroidota bacterium]
MKINNQHYETIWQKADDPTTIQIIDQRYLPHRFVIEDLRRLEDFVAAIKEMHVRGAPLIGATAAYGMYKATLEAPKNGDASAFLAKAATQLKNTRPTAVDLFHAVNRCEKAIAQANSAEARTAAALTTAHAIIDESRTACRQIGLAGLPLIKAISAKKGGAPVNVLTHCNAGWIACIDYGTATAPIYFAHDKGIPVHVWVDETRPRNQGARITAFELLQHGVPHTVIPDNTGGHLMQHGMVDLVIVGTDRTTRGGDVANKIGTYLKALAAHDNGVPFYVALPSSSIDWTIQDGLKEIPIEQRGQNEVSHVQGLVDGKIKKVQITPSGSPTVNYGFDVTPSRYVTGLITDRGICPSTEAGLLGLYPEQAVSA